MTDLLPLNRDWVSPSVIFGEVALCRDREGRVWLCRLNGEDGGWEKMQPAKARDVEAFRWSQRLAGKAPQPWPAWRRRNMTSEKTRVEYVIKVRGFSAGEVLTDYCAHVRSLATPELAAIAHAELRRRERLRRKVQNVAP